MSTLTCPNCRNTNRPGAQFCRVCGTQLIAPVSTPGSVTPPLTTIVICHSCKHANRPDAKFCANCGQKLGLPSSSPSPPKIPYAPTPNLVPIPPAQNISLPVIQGQVISGEKNYLVQVGGQHGVVIDPAPAGLQPLVEARLVSGRPQLASFPDLLDRQAEVNAALDSIRLTLPVEFSGQDGLGKTSLLQHLAHHPGLPAFPDGVVFHSVYKRPAGDVLQLLYDDFYTSPTNFKPSDAQIAHALQVKQAVIMLDEVGLERQEVERLLNHAPNCSFVLSSTERQLWQRGRAMNLTGLPLKDGVALMERELGRPVTPIEKPEVENICKTLAGNPLYLQRVAIRVSQCNELFSDINRQLKPPMPAIGHSRSILISLSRPERRVLAPLAVLGTVPIRVEDLAAVTGLQRVDQVLLSLQRQRLVQSHSPRFSLTGGLAEIIQGEQDLTTGGEKLLSYFIGWAERRSFADDFMQEADLLQRLLEWGSRAARWSQVLRLAIASEAALALNRQWEIWKKILEWALQAARALGDQVAEAWALHQLGSRALTIGEVNIARQILTEALRLRESLGDKAGAEITRHNLNLLVIPTPPIKSARPGAVKPFPILPVAIAVALVLAILVGFGAYLFFRDDSGESSQTPFIQPTDLPVIIPTQTLIPSKQSRPSLTPSPANIDPIIPSLTQFNPHSHTPSLTPSATLTFIPTSTDTSTPTRTNTPTSSLTPTNTRIPTITYTPTPPDLVIGDFVIDQGRITVGSDRITIPVRMLLRNKGGSPADNFRIIIYYYSYYRQTMRYQNPTAGYILREKTAGLTINEMSLVPRLLGTSKFNFQGEVFLPAWLAGQNVELYVVADDCPDDSGFSQPECRVREENEQNNDFSIMLTLPDGAVG